MSGAIDEEFRFVDRPRADTEAAAALRFRLRPTCIDALPVLAWLADVDPGSDEARLLHGRFVEVEERFFVEGAWSGDFERGEIAAASTVFGSGGTVSGHAIAFVSSLATTDYLYYRRVGRRVIVANSLPFLLAWSDDSLDPRCDRYAAINASVVDGVIEYCRDLPTRKGSVRRLMFRNLEVTREEVREVDKPSPPAFETYDDYVGYIDREYERLAANMRARGRANRLHVYSTQSKGYDSTAINALARRYGIDAAFTVTKGKAKGKFAIDDEGEEVDDDGSEICRELGIPCIPIDRRAFEKERPDEYLYYATLDNNGDMNLAEIMDRASSPGALLTGCLGEMWYTRTPSRTPDIAPTLRRWDLGNHGLTEVRLQSGLIQVAPIYIGATRRADIVRITESPEMAPWRLGGEYDRPIPRRIAETAGVRRSAFGQAKAASVVEFPPPRIPFGRDLRLRYFEFLVRHGLRSRLQTRLFPAVHFVNAYLHFVSSKRHKPAYYLQRIISKILGRAWQFERLWSDLDSSIFCFAVNLRLGEYVEALRGAELMSEPATTDRRHIESGA